MKKLFHELKTYKGFYLMLILVPLAAVMLSAGIIWYGYHAKETSHNTYLQNGYTCLEAGNYTEAITAFEEAYRIKNSYDAAVGLAKAWFGSGDAEKAIQILTARSELYTHTDEMDALIEEYNITLGIYPTVLIGGKEIETNSTTIYIRDVTLTEEDKQALAQFTHMVTLDLTNCGLTDIAFLKDCSKLMSVTLTENPITDFTPLLDKPELRTLYINDTAITDYSQLHAFTTLTLLNANGNWIPADALDAVRAALPGCEVIAGLNGYLITNVTVGGETYLSDSTELDLSGRNLSDVTPLKEFTNLRKLNLSNNRISWITPMEDLDRITDLDMSGNRFTNITALEKMTGMTRLILADNKVTDISVLAFMPALTELNLSNNSIYHGHEVLASLTALENLNMQNTMLKDEHLSILPMGSMKQLDLRNNKQLSEAAVLDFIAAHPDCTIHTDFNSTTE